MIKPAALNANDVVAIVSPAGAVRDHSFVHKAACRLEEWGLKVRIASHALSCNGCYSGTVSERKDDLLTALGDADVKAVLCSYGGYGCVHLLDEFAATIAHNPKWIMGMSDCSALLAACASSGVMSIHSMQSLGLSGHSCENSIGYLRNILFGGITRYTLPANVYNVPGMAQGRLAGGNMSVLCGLMRTPYDVFQDDIILFIEDVNEPVYRIERMLYNLKLAGVLNRIKGLVVGQFVGTREHLGFGGTVYDIIHNVVADCGIPVCFDFPLGHGIHNYPLIVGADAELCVGADGVSLCF